MTTAGKAVLGLMTDQEEEEVRRTIAAEDNPTHIFTQGGEPTTEEEEEKTLGRKLTLADKALRKIMTEKEKGEGLVDIINNLDDEDVMELAWFVLRGP